MLYRLPTAISTRMLQVYQVASWQRPDLIMSNIDDGYDVRQHCPRMATLIESTIETLTPDEVGIFSSVLSKCVLTLTVFMVQQPTIAQTYAFTIRLHSFFLSSCPNVPVDRECLGQLAVFIHTVIRSQSETNAQYAIGRAALLNIHTYAEICKAVDLNRQILDRINMAIFREELPLLCKKYGLRQMITFTCAYRRESYHRNHEVPLPLIDPIEFSPDSSEAEYYGIGQSVDITAFCKAVKIISGYNECPICTEKIELTEPGNEQQPITTNCGHIYHYICLYSWVNLAAMETSNTCPACRTVLCKPRERRHTAHEITLAFES